MASWKEYDLHVDDLAPEHLEALEKAIGEGNFNEGYPYFDWKSLEKDMKSISKKFPKKLFVIDAVDDKGNKTTHKFKNGKRNA